MLRILSLDPSGTGKTGICLINGKKITFQQYQSPEWKKHYAFISQLVQAEQSNLVLYETTNYINSRGKDMTSLFRLMGALEWLPVKLDSILVHQVKDLKAKLLAGTKQIPHLTCQPGRGKGWMFKGKRISLHQLDAYLVYYLWKERQRTCFEFSGKEEKHE